MAIYGLIPPLLVMIVVICGGLGGADDPGCHLCGDIQGSSDHRGPPLSSLWRESGVCGPPRTPVVLATAGIGGLRGSARCRRPSLSSP